MALFVSYFLVALALLLAIPVGILLLEIIASLIIPMAEIETYPNVNNRKHVAVLVPAHNESTGILPTLDDIKAQLRSGDRLLVVADNCIDDTAAVAATVGAEVIERNDSTRTGKGYALDFGVNHLRLDPPAVVIIIDADCGISRGAIDELATICATTARPVQALYLMTASDNSPIKYHVAEFAWRMKNWIRPLGLHKLKLPCQMMGTGMAFPWEMICSANLATGSIVEDLKLGLELAQMGNAPIFCPSASVKSQFPLSVEGAINQRKRWEHGHTEMILTMVPRFIFKAIAGRNWQLLALTLDLAVPPLSLLVIFLSGIYSVAGVVVFFGVSSAPLIICACSLLVLALAIFVSWLKYGRDVLPASALLLVPAYIVSKLPIYRHFLFGKVSSKWTRTDRTKKE